MPELDAPLPETEAAPPDAPAKPAAQSERPAWLPEGFESPEDFRKAYDDLKSPKADDAPADLPKDEAVTQFVADSGLDPVVLSRQIAETGTVDAKSRAALEARLKKAGLPAGLIDDYVSGQRHLAESIVNDVYQSVGGVEEFQGMAAWAKENLPPAELTAVSDLLEKGNPQQAKIVLKALYGQYKASAPAPGRRVKGRASQASGDIFQSLEQQVAAQADPRYGQDPAFREDVRKKIQRTLDAGGYRFRTR